MRALSLLLLGVLTACSAVVSGGRQSVMVTTGDISGAECSLTDSKGRVWYVENTPGTAYVKKGDGPISVICKKEGYEVSTALLKEDLNMSTNGNLALGPAAPIGYFIDSVTGAGEKYESSIEVEMEPASKRGKKPWE